jgi:twinkle protein
MEVKTFHDFGINLPHGASGEVDTVCPSCTPARKPENRHKKDLSVNVEKGTWFCNHCGYADGLRKGGSYKVPTKTSYEKPKPLPPKTSDTLWDNTVAYYATRGISEQTLNKAGVTVAMEWCPECEALGRGKSVGHTLFPFIVDGEHLNTKHRCALKHFKLEKGAQRVLFNSDSITGDEMIIVEGEIDALSLIEAGFDNVVSVPDGAPSPESKNYASKFSFFEPAEELFTRIRRVVIAVDADAPGQKLAEELVRRIGEEKCSRVLWDDGVKDANDCLTNLGTEFLRISIESAQNYPVPGIWTGLDLYNELSNLYDFGSDPGVYFGVPALDELYRVVLGNMTIVTGIPSHGKSTVVDQLLMWLAQKEGWGFGIFSPEQQPLVRHQEVLIQQYLGKPFSAGPTTRMTKAEMREGNDWVSRHFSFILPEEPSLENILALAEKEIFRKGIRGIVIDPFNELEVSRPANKSMTEYIGELLMQIRNFARKHKIHAWVVAHPYKMKKNLEDGAEPVPGLWDISDSAHFRNKADVGLTVWRDLRYPNVNEVQLHVTKMRFDTVGTLGKCNMLYDKTTKRLIEMPRPEDYAVQPAPPVSTPKNPWTTPTLPPQAWSQEE